VNLWHCFTMIGHVFNDKIYILTENNIIMMKKCILLLVMLILISNVYPQIEYSDDSGDLQIAMANNQTHITITLYRHVLYYMHDIRDPDDPQYTIPTVRSEPVKNRDIKIWDEERINVLYEVKTQ